MSDLFHEGNTDEEIAAAFGVMAYAQDHTFQVLTKRPARAAAWFKALAGAHADPLERIAWAATLHGVPGITTERLYYVKGGGRWPLRNVQLGVSVSRQPDADRDIPVLLELPAAAHVVSYEPALGPVDFLPWLEPFVDLTPALVPTPRLAWVIVGGESGYGARPFDLAWPRSTVRQCAAAGVPVFVKQFGARPFDGAEGWLRLEDRKGGDMSEWPKDLRVREFPRAA